MHIPFILACPLMLWYAAGAAQDPVGAWAECGPGRTFRVQCYFNEDGYLADVVYRNTVPPTDVAICNTPQDWLQDPVVLEISASDSFIRMHVCSDSRGVRGLALDTALGETLTCGVTANLDAEHHGHVQQGASGCSTYSSRGTYPLGGFAGSCAAQPGQPVGMVRLMRLFNTCWNIKPTARITGEGQCHCWKPL